MSFEKSIKTLNLTHCDTRYEQIVASSSTYFNPTSEKELHLESIRNVVASGLSPSMECKEVQYWF